MAQGDGWDVFNSDVVDASEFWWPQCETAEGDGMIDDVDGERAPTFGIGRHTKR